LSVSLMTLIQNQL